MAAKKREPRPAEKLRESKALARQRHRPRLLEQQRKHSLKHTYNMTLDAYDALVAAQGGLCAICEKPETAQKNGVVKRLAVDHDHATGQIRGLLCTNCNTVLGHAHDDVRVLEAAIQYLSRTLN